MIEKSTWAYLWGGAYLWMTFEQRNTIFLKTWLQEYFFGPFTKFYVKLETFCSFWVQNLSILQIKQCSLVRFYENHLNLAQYSLESKLTISQ